MKSRYLGCSSSDGWLDDIGPLVESGSISSWSTISDGEGGGVLASETLGELSSIRGLFGGLGSWLLSAEVDGLGS